MDVDAFELFKNTRETNQLDWMKNLLLIEYAEVVSVYDVNTVKVQLLVQSGEIPITYVVRLLHTGNSHLLENIVMPVEHDQVMLFFLRSHDDAMFLDPEVTAHNDPNGKSFITSDYPNRYNVFSGVGILAAPARANAPTVIHHTQDANGPLTTIDTAAKILAAFKAAVSMVFDSPPAAEGETPPSAPINVLFGRASPVSIEHRSTLNLKFKQGATVTVLSNDSLSVQFDEGLDLKDNHGNEIAFTESGLTLNPNSAGGTPAAAREEDAIEVTAVTDEVNFPLLEAVCSIFGLPFGTTPLEGKITGGSATVKVGG